MNLNQEVESADAAAEIVAPTDAGVIVKVRNKAASPLRLVIASSFTGDSWCLPLYGGGGFYPWSRFTSRCATPASPGTPYGGKQPISSLSIQVPGNAAAPVPFDFCLDDLQEARTGPVESCAPESPTCTPSVIDDFEGRAGFIYSQDGRSGHWYTYHDFSTDGGAWTVTEQGSPGYQSDHAIQGTGGGFTIWGMGLGARLNQPPGAPRGHAYDASRYEGFKFWYRSKAAIGVLVRTLATTSSQDPRVEGGTCSRGVNECPSFGFSAPAVQTWTELKLHWADLVQPPNSQIPDTVLDPKTVVELRFETYIGADFDYSIDDLSFF